MEAVRFALSAPCEPMRIALLLTCVLSLVCLSSAKPRKDMPYITLRPAETLHIEVLDHIYMSGIGEDDRFRRIEKVIEEVIEEVDFPMPYKIERFGAQRTPPNQPRLDITIMKWGDNGLSEIEVRFNALLRRNHDKNRMGVFFARDAAPIGSFNRTIRAHNQVMEEAIKEMVKELKTRLSARVLEEVEMDLGEVDDISGDE